MKSHGELTYLILTLILFSKLIISQKDYTRYQSLDITLSENETYFDMENMISSMTDCQILSDGLHARSNIISIICPENDVIILEAILQSNNLHKHRQPAFFEIEERTGHVTGFKHDQYLGKSYRDCSFQVCYSSSNERKVTFNTS